ncbi:CAP and S-layer homology domain-containing protein [Thermolongibacillus altinsuensis]
MKYKALSGVLSLSIFLGTSFNVLAHEGRLESNGGQDCSQESIEQDLCEGYDDHTFSDVPEGYWAKKEIEYLVQEGIITGYDDGTFKPEKLVTRLQAATMLVRALGLDMNHRPDPGFTDIQKGDYGYEYVAAVVDEGIFSKGNTFNPDQPLTRGQMAKILVKAFGLQGDYQGEIIDVPEEFESYVRVLAANGITKLYHYNTYKPNEVVKRAHFAVFFARVKDPQFREKPLMIEAIHTIPEIKQKWKEYEPTFQGDPYVVKPNVTPPYSIGKLNNQIIDDGIKMVNFVRYLAGLPDDIISDDSLNELSQYGAVVTAANGYLSHRPSKPKSMSDAFFELGYKSTSSSNLHMISEGGPTYFSMIKGIELGSYLSYSVYSYMSDSDSSNIDRVGHRRWILSPDMQKVGFGLANDQKWFYSPMYVFDLSRLESVDWEYTSWPSKGYFPYQFFDPLDAWSIHLNPDLYSEPIIDHIKVTLIRLNDNKQWTFTKLNNTVTSSDDYLNVNDVLYGHSYAIIFRPSGVDSYENSTYKVIISGVQKKDGENVTIEFITQFFNL